MKNTVLKSLLLCLLLASCSSPGSGGSEPDESEVRSNVNDTIRLALDWRPNVLHSGIFMAQKRGWYGDSGLVVHWFTPEIDDYTKKPLKRVLDGEADLSVGPSEHLFYYALDSNAQPEAIAVATLLQRDMSAFVVPATEGIDRPAEMDGHVYLGYHTPLEEEILSRMIINDGGRGQFTSKHPARLSVWDGFMDGQGDIAWVFLHWEALKAERAGTKLRAFIPNDYGVPYGCSSVIMAPAEADGGRREKIQRFLGATAAGYQEVVADPEAAVKELSSFIDHPNFSDRKFILLAQKEIAPAYLDSLVPWGYMEADKWERYLRWMEVNNLIADSLQMPPAKNFFTNELLPLQQ